MRPASIRVREIPKGYLLDGKVFRPMVHQMDAHANLGLRTKIPVLHNLVGAGNDRSSAGCSQLSKRKKCRNHKRPFAYTKKFVFHFAPQSFPRALAGKHSSELP